MNTVVTHGVLLQFLKYVSDELRSEVSSRLRRGRVGKGRALIEKEARSSEVYFVLEGRAEVVLYSSNGREVCVNTIGAGDVFGEISAIDGKPRSASVVALSDFAFVTMKSEDFRACIEASPSAALWLTQRFASDIRRLTELAFELSALNVRTRIHHELLRLAHQGKEHDGVVDISPAPTHAALAKRIGTHREAVTREMHALSDMGIVSYDRRCLTIRDRRRLQRVLDL